MASSANSPRTGTTISSIASVRAQPIPRKVRYITIKTDGTLDRGGAAAGDVTFTSTAATPKCVISLTGNDWGGLCVVPRNNWSKGVQFVFSLETTPANQAAIGAVEIVSEGQRYGKKTGEGTPTAATSGAMQIYVQPEGTTDRLYGGGATASQGRARRLDWGHRADLGIEVAPSVAQGGDWVINAITDGWEDEQARV